MADQGEAFDPTLQPGPQGQSSDASQPSTLRQMWDNWTSRPENNAAMVNFGLQLMQPVPAGQSQLGHFAEAIGAGGEAGGRVATQEEERQRADEAEALKEQEAARKERETDIYGRSVNIQAQRAAAGGITPLKLWQAKLKAGSDFDKWAQTEDITGSDPKFKNIQLLHPEIKDKAGYLRSPYYKQDKDKYIQEHAAEFLPDSGIAGSAIGGGGGIVGGGGGGEGEDTGFTPPPGAVVRYQGNRPIYYDPKTKQPYPGQE